MRKTPLEMTKVGREANMKGDFIVKGISVNHKIYKRELVR